MNFRYVDGQTLAAFVGVNRGTIRKWASLGYITRRGTGPFGRALYDPREVAVFAAAQRTKNVRPPSDNGDMDNADAA